VAETTPGKVGSPRRSSRQRSACQTAI